MTTEKTRDETFEAVLAVLGRLQREGVLSFEQVNELNRVICRYGSACSEEGSAITRQTLRPQLPEGALS